MKSVSEFPISFAVDQLNKEELHVLRMLEDQAPHLLSSYADSLAKARSASLQRVLMCLLREDAWGIFSRAYDLQIAASIVITDLPDSLEFAERMITGNSLIEDGWYKAVILQEKELLLIPIRHAYAFRRIETGEKAFYIQKASIKEITSISDLRFLFSENASSSKLMQELENSSANLALSYAYEKERKNRATIQEENTIQYVLAEQKRNAAFRSDLFFEQLCTQGHNLHPCAKTKMDMKAHDVFAYSPEFEHPVPLRFIALHKKSAEWNYSEGKEEILFQAFPNLRKCMDRELQEQDLNSEDYIPVPVHPWQMEHILPVIYECELQERIVVPITDFCEQSYATASFRTLLTGELGIKGAIRSQMTSTVRSISPQTANNAALVTDVIKKIMKREPALNRIFVPVYELGGGSLRSEQEDKKRNLSFVVRESISKYVGENEVAVVGAALYSDSLVTGKPVLLDIIKEYARAINVSSLSEAASVFFSEYASILLEGCLTLMVKYGIGLEAHLQNIVSVFRNGRPVRMLFRDWGGVRIYAPRLDSHSFMPDFYPNSLIITDSVKEMHNKVFYTAVQNHLGEIIYLLCRHTEVVEEDLWKNVKNICDTIFQKWEQEYKEAVVLDRQAFYTEQTDYKALLTMRLNEGEKGYSYAKVDNPLANAESLL